MKRITSDLKSQTSHTISVILLTLGLAMGIASYSIGNTALAQG